MGWAKYPGELNIWESARWQLYTVKESGDKSFPSYVYKDWDNGIIKLLFSRTNGTQVLSKIASVQLGSISLINRILMIQLGLIRFN